MNRLRNQWGLLLVAAAVILIFWQLPLGTALEFGHDEGFEVIKPFLCLKGFSLYKEIWNDQPPVFTVLLTWAFKAWGPTIRVARLVSAGFALLLFLAFFQLVRQRSGPWAALLATFLLLASPVVLQLGASVMLETPAFATALVSVLLLFQWSRRPHWAWLLASGALLGIALQIKLTAVLVVPAMVAEIAVTRWASRDRNRSWRRLVVRDLLQWGAALVAVFAVIGVVWASGSFLTSWKSHFGSHSAAGRGKPEDYAFPGKLLVSHTEGVLAALVGLVLLVRGRRWREGAFPMALLLTVVAIHAVHRPWWNYYYLHLAIPLAWLGGVCAREIISAASGLLSATRFRVASARTWKGIALCGLAALPLAQSEKRLEATVRDLRQRPTVASSPLLAKMRQYAQKTHWAYADPVIYPFHARIPVPPELAIVMLKRFWSGQLTTEGIIEACKRYKVEQLVLSARTAAQWREFLASDYTLVGAEKGLMLYVAKSLAEPSAAPGPTAGSRTEKDL